MLVSDSLDTLKLPSLSISGSEVLADLGDADLSSEDKRIEVAVQGEFALVDGGVVVSDDGVPDGVGRIDEVNVNDVEDLVEDAAASRRLEAVLGAQRLSEAILGLEDSELSLDAVDSLEEDLSLEELVLFGEGLEKPQQVDDSLLVDVEDVFLLVFNGLVDEDLLDDVLGSPLDVTVVLVDGLVDGGSGNSDVVVLNLSSNVVDQLVLSDVKDVDLVVGLGKQSFELSDSGLVSLVSGSGGDDSLSSGGSRLSGGSSLNGGS